MRVVLDTLVRPSSRITDYVTQFSGITAAMMKHARHTVDDVRAQLRRLLPRDAVLVGHTFNCDLVALRMAHPYVIDISLLYNLSGRSRARTSLQALAKIFLKVSSHASVALMWAGLVGCAIGQQWSLFNRRRNHNDEIVFIEAKERVCAARRVCVRAMWNAVRLRFGNVMHGWDYNEYALMNGLNVASGTQAIPTNDGLAVNTITTMNGADRSSHKRTFDKTDLEYVAKRQRLEQARNNITSSESIGDTYTNMYTCDGCKQLVMYTCRSDECACRRVRYRGCMACTGGNEDDPCRIAQTTTTADDADLNWRLVWG
jgi:hypothetical protein